MTMLSDKPGPRDQGPSSAAAAITEDSRARAERNPKKTDQGLVYAHAFGDLSAVLRVMDLDDLTPRQYAKRYGLIGESDG